MKQLKINWVCLSPGADRSVRGYWLSAEGRFYISPNYWGRINPQDFTLHDRLRDKRYTYDAVRDCKQTALALASNELKKEM